VKNEEFFKRENEFIEKFLPIPGQKLFLTFNRDKGGGN